MKWSKLLIPCFHDSSCSKLSFLSLDSVQRITLCIWNKYATNLTNAHLVECKPEGSLQVMEQWVLVGYVLWNGQAMAHYVGYSTRQAG
jgi:hypothetical protein